MKQQEILKLAREAGACTPNENTDWAFIFANLEKFANLVIAHERQRIINQKPVGYWQGEENNFYSVKQESWSPEPYPNIPLYALYQIEDSCDVNMQPHTSGKQLHHFALVLRDLDKTYEGWCEEPEFYLDGERLYAAPVQQAEQEPVAYLCPSFVDNFATGRYETCERTDYGAFPVYSAPVRTKDLTDEEIHKLVKQVRFDGMTDRTFQFARAVIQEFRRKNGIV